MIDKWPVDPVEGFEQQNWDFLKSLFAIFAAPGMMYPYMGSTAPPGTALVQGQAVTTSAKAPKLRQLLIDAGNPFGVSGSDPRLPDMRGRTIVGAGTGSGLTARTLGGLFGTETHVLTVAELAAHDHGGNTGGPSWSAGMNVYSAGGATNFVAITWGGNFIGADANKYNGLAHTHAIASQGNNTAHPNMQPSIGLNWLVIIQ